MKKIWKILLVLVVVVMVIAITGTIVLRIMFPPQKVKGIIIMKMSEFLHREIKIKSVSIGFTGLKVEGLSVSERPSFNKGRFVEAQKFVIKPDLMALFKKQISINKIVLVSPKINIVKYKNGSFNFSDLMVASTVTKKEPQKESIPFSFLVSKLTISGGDVAFADKSPQDLSAEIKNINVNISGISLVSPVSIEASMNILFKKMDSYFSLQSSVDIKQQQVKIKELLVSLNGAGLKVSGTVDKFMSPDKLLLDLTVKDEKLSLEKLVKILPELKDFGLSGTIVSNTKITGGFNVFSVSGKTDFENVEFIQKAITARVSRTDFNYSAKIINFKKGNIDLKLGCQAVEIKMPETNAKAAAVKQVPLEKKVTVKFGIPPGFDVQGNIEVEKFVFQDLQVSGFLAKLNLTNSILTVDPLSLTTCNGSVNCSLNADLSDMRPENLKFTFNGDIKNFDLNVFFNSMGMKQKAQIRGITDGNMKITGKGTEMASLGGSGNMQIKNAKMNQIKILDSLAVVAMKPGLKETSFKLITSRINITSGKISLLDTKTDGGDKLDAYCSGNVNLVSKSQDIKGEIKFTKEYSGGDFARYTADSEGRVTVPFTVQGSFDNPKVSLDWNKIANTAIKNETKRIIMQEGEKLLKGFFSK